MQPIPPELGANTSPLSLRWLMDHTGLTIYGDFGLTPAVYKNLAAAAVLLSLLFVIDVLAWTGSWNMLFTGSVSTRGPLLFVALPMGVLCASGILWYESTFFSTNFKTAKLPWMGVIMRIFFVGVIGLVTSVPIDLFLLKENVNERIHQERVLDQVPALVNRWEKAQGVIAGTSDVAKVQIEDQTIKQTSALTDAHNVVTQRIADLVGVRKELGVAKAHLRSLISALAVPGLQPAEVQRYSGLISQARQEVERLARLDTAASQRSTEASIAEQKADLDLKQVRADAKLHLVRVAAADQRRYEAWIQKLLAAKPLQAVIEQPMGETEAPPKAPTQVSGKENPMRGTGPVLTPDLTTTFATSVEALTYDGLGEESNLGPGQRLIVLSDILSGRPPRRPQMEARDREVAKSMGLGRFVEETDDPTETERRRDEATQLQRLTAFVFGIFTAFPILAMSLKFYFDRETSDYFDAAFQRSIGNPRAPRERRPPADVGHGMQNDRVEPQGGRDSRGNGVDLRAYDQREPFHGRDRYNTGGNGGPEHRRDDGHPDSEFDDQGPHDGGRHGWR